ncbi:MAG: hypothetical protein DCF23_01390 [Cyanobium sp.]|nr:MAG: hypothetical protein DCF23_01390 [Cyanobium sp.]
MANNQVVSGNHQNGAGHEGDLMATAPALIAVVFSATDMLLLLAPQRNPSGQSACSRAASHFSSVQ